MNNDGRSYREEVYRQCYYIGNALISECFGSAFGGRHGCTCRVRPSRSNIQLPVEITTRKELNFMAEFKRRHPGFVFYTDMYPNAPSNLRFIPIP